MYHKKYNKYNSKIDNLRNKYLSQKQRNNLLYGSSVQLHDRTINFDNIEEKMRDCEGTNISIISDILGCYQMTYNTSFWDQISQELGNVDIKLLCLSSDVSNMYLHSDAKIPEILSKSIRGINFVLSCNSDTLAKTMNNLYNNEGRYFIGFEYNVHIINNVIIMAKQYSSWNICDIIARENWQTLDMPTRIQKILDMKLLHLLSNRDPSTNTANTVYLKRQTIINKLRVLVNHMTSSTTPSNTESTFRFKQDGTPGNISLFGVDTYIAHQTENWKTDYQEYLRIEEEKRQAKIREELRKKEEDKLTEQQKKQAFSPIIGEIPGILQRKISEMLSNGLITQDDVLQYNNFVKELASNNFAELTPKTKNEEDDLLQDAENYISDKFILLYDEKYPVEEENLYYEE
jgi:hypothetical protein